MKIFLIVFLSALGLRAGAQDKNAFYAMDAEMNPTVLDSSKYLLWVHQKEDANWQWDYYYTWGALLKSQSYADHDGKILNGRSCLYNKSGNLDSTGVFDHGKRNGTFFKWKTITPDSAEIVKQYDYTQDSLVKMVDVHPKTNQDSAGSRESEYPGGLAAWNSYLGSHINYPDRALNKNIQGTVKIYFMLDESGKVQEAYIQKSVEYSLDQEALKVIQGSGAWTPGMANGVNKKTYKLMPIRFRLEK